MSGRRGRAVAALALLWAFAGCCWALPGGAYAADFIVKNCSDEVPAYAVDALYEGSGRVEGRHCNDAGSLGQMQLNGRGGATAAGEYGAWVWQAGGGAGIVGASIQARLRNAGGWAAQLYALRRDGTTDLFGTASDGAFAGYHLSEAGAGPAGAARVVAQLKCYRPGGCDLATLGGATARPDDIQLTVRDDEPPSATAAGPLLEANAETRWHRGVEEVSISAADTGSGIGSWWMRIDGTRAASLGSQACPGDRGAYAVSTRPCPASASARFPVDTAGLSAGSHSVELCAADYGGAATNLGCSRSYAIRVDNAAPLQPQRLEVAGGEDRWHPERSFDLAWTLPAQTGGSPIASVHARVLDDAGGVAVPHFSFPAAARLDDLQVPNDPGLYTAEVWLEDAAGNTGPAAIAALRFDDRRPGPAPPLPAGQWLSRGEVPHLQRLGHPQAPLPAAGIEGYAISVDRDPGGDPCAAEDRCTSAETDLKDGIDGDRLQITDLAEGVNHVHAAAVSRSGMKSAVVRHAEIHFDRTDPVTTLSGAPPGWTSQPAELTARAQDPLSGMAPAEGGAPATFIQVDGGTPVSAPGGTASAVVADEGVHRIAYYARDLAGNANDGLNVNGVQDLPPSIAVVRIDRTGPALAFADAQDRGDPELIRASLEDALSGPDPARGLISVRRAGSTGPFDPLPTELAEGGLEARWDSDADPHGEYEFRATAYDRAGNESSTGRRASGAPMVLANPIKVATELRLVPGGGPGARGSRGIAVAYRASPLLRGRLTVAGTPLRGEELQVFERYAPGSSTATRATTVRSGPGGRFTVRLRPGPSRTVQVRYAGSRALSASRSATVPVRVAGMVSLRTTSRVAIVGGRPLVFSGRVGQRGAESPPDGKQVELQYRTGTGSWTTFRSLDADRSGKFRLAYRFVDDESHGVVFRFRAVAGREGGWPYGAAVSPPRTVVGR